jgi:hypothetical protein
LLRPSGQMAAKLCEQLPGIIFQHKQSLRARQSERSVADGRSNPLPDARHLASGPIPESLGKQCLDVAAMDDQEIWDAPTTERASAPGSGCHRV